MPLQYSVDSINMGLARLIYQETGSQCTVAITKLPDGIKVGDILVFNGRNYRILHHRTQRVRHQNKRQLDMLFTTRRAAP
jgi:S-adenosylmethionine:tRNA-ribosyltransferase-isomerase (queuine synthetase)